MGKANITLTIEENLLEKARDKFPRKLSAKIEELLEIELDEELQRDRIEKEKKQAQETVERCNKQLKAFEKNKQEKSRIKPDKVEIFKPAIDKAVQICIESENRWEYLKPKILKVQAKNCGLTGTELLSKIEEYKSENNIDKDLVEPDSVQSLS
ncbi:MAG: hypothetical protein QHH15_00410 [Candidatus Thermoplasmatota archaeon]|nr:hypothetical protein [Candidatus Thermoplasmatota archaeon]MDH7506236.1 hypothetical protein [Candidatus Thermoplasmatota archaeon]